MSDPDPIIARIDQLQADIELRFAALQADMELRFDRVNLRLDALATRQELLQVTTVLLRHLEGHQ